jgi:hypothetical protein
VENRPCGVSLKPSPCSSNDDNITMSYHLASIVFTTLKKRKLSHNVTPQCTFLI